MKKRFLAALATGLLVVGFSGSAYCLSVTDVLMDYDLDGYYESADAVSGSVTDNDNITYVNSAFSTLYGGGNFVLLDKSDDLGSVGSSINGFVFTLTANKDWDNVEKEWVNTGDFTLSWTSGNPPAWFDFVFAVMASNEFGLYLFDDIMVNSASGSYPGEYTITFANNGGNLPDLSHMSVYGRAGSPVPEPATMLLFGTGLAGLAGIARRRKKA